MSVIIKRTRVTQDAPLAPVHSETSIRVLKADGEVFAVELTCTCGDVNVIELVQADVGATPQRSAAAPQ